MAIKFIKIKDSATGIISDPFPIGTNYENVSVVTDNLKDFLHKNPDGGYYEVDNSIMDEIKNVEENINVIDKSAIDGLFKN